MKINWNWPAGRSGLRPWYLLVWILLIPFPLALAGSLLLSLADLLAGQPREACRRIFGR